MESEKGTWGMETRTQGLSEFCGQRLIRQEKELKRLRTLVYKDELTGLMNYRAFREGMGKLLGEDDAYGLIYLDLDQFKEVNDTFGHLAGDRLLREVAGALNRAAGSLAQVYRLGGDEFALIVTAAEQLLTVRERVLTEFEQAENLEISGLRVSASVGTAQFPEDGRTYDEMLGSADCCMYADKYRRKAGMTTET